MLDAIPLQLQEDIAQILMAIIAFVVVWLLRHMLVGIVRRVMRRFSSGRNGSLDTALGEAVSRPVSILTLALAIDGFLPTTIAR